MYQREIPELLVLYEFEPELRAVWVEGSSDQAFWRWYISEKGLGQVGVNSIDQVNVPTNILKKYGLTPSNRNRAIATALELEAGLRQVARHATILIIVDLDFDFFSERQIETKFLAYTDFTSLEIYLFDRTILTKFLQLATINPDRSVDLLMENLGHIGYLVFLIRAANEMLGWAMSLHEPRKQIAREGNSISFDNETYLHRALMANGRIKDREIFDQQLVSLAEKKPKDVRLSMRGHDFINLLTLLLRDEIRPKAAAKDSEIVSKLLQMAAEPSLFSEYSLFSRVDAELSNHT